MNAHQIAANRKPTTIGELKQYLADMEAKWDEQDCMYLGEFDNQTLHVLTDKGVATCNMQYFGEFGLIAFPIE